MNLRIKRKHAKQKLEHIVESEKKRKKYFSTIDMYLSYESKKPLEDIINTKRKLRLHYQWNEEEPKVDWDKITYFSIWGEYTKLGEIFYPNGQYLMMSEIHNFLNSDRVRNNMYAVGRKTANRNPEKETWSQYDRYVDYWIEFSMDKTKNKKLHSEKLYYQFYGSDRIYLYEKENVDDKSN